MFVQIKDGIIQIDKKYLHLVMQKKRTWYVNNSGYATLIVRKNKIYTTYLLHRLIMNAKSGQMVDHKNRNKLNNRSQNLRLCTRAQNNQNSRVHKSKTASRYKGVKRHPSGWEARITHNKKLLYLGFYKTESAAFKAYLKAAKEYHGEYSIYAGQSFRSAWRGNTEKS